MTMRHFTHHADGRPVSIEKAAIIHFETHVSGTGTFMRLESIGSPIDLHIREDYMAVLEYVCRSDRGMEEEAFMAGRAEEQAASLISDCSQGDCSENLTAMARRGKSDSLHALYDERVEITIRINVLEGTGEDPGVLEQSRNRLIALNKLIIDIERSRLQSKD